MTPYEQLRQHLMALFQQHYAPQMGMQPMRPMGYSGMGQAAQMPQPYFGMGQGQPPQMHQQLAMPGGQSPLSLGQDWQTTGVFPNGGFDANAINASNPVARQNALHILNDYGGENRESQNQQDAQSNTDQANQNQQNTGVYGYGGLG
jgi:hypothetical protein